MAKGGGASRPRFRLLPTVLLTAAIFALPTAVYGWGRSSSSFTIHKVAVSGTRLVPERRIVRLLRRDFLGHNLFTVTKKDVRESLAAACFVADVRVDRDFPDTLRVSVVEHLPAVYALADGRWYVVADDAHVICEEKAPKLDAAPAGGGGTEPAPSPSATPATVAAASGDAAAAPDAADGASGAGAAETAGGAAAEPPATEGASARTLADLQAGPPGAALHLPRLATQGPVAVGQTLTDPGVRDALRVVTGLPRGLRHRLDLVEVADAGQFTLRFADGLVVAWGGGDRALAKTLALRVVLDAYERASQECTFVDVSLPDRVLARPILK